MKTREDTLWNALFLLNQARAMLEDHDIVIDQIETGRDKVWKILEREFGAKD